MLAAVFEGEGRLVLKDVAEPTIESSGDLLVEVEACGICGTDLHILEVPPGHPGTPGTVMGHEFVGRVVEIGPDVHHIAVGQRVVVDPDPKCGNCTSCRAGRPGDCTNISAIGIFRDGALASLVVVPAVAVFPIAEHVPAELAALAEPLACVVNGVNRAVPKPGEPAIVFGAGPIGCLYTAVLRQAGADPIIVVEPSTNRHAVACALGATIAVAPSELAEAMQRLMPGGAAIVVDAVGAVLREAIHSAAMGGRIVLFGMNDNATPSIPQVEITRKGLTVLGAYITNFTFPPAIRLIESGRLPLSALITEVFPLARVADAFDQMRSGAAGKMIIRP